MFPINATPSPVDGGAVTGAGSYTNATTATLVAKPAGGYGFANWMENGAVVSVLTNYSFTVTSNRNLVANFTLQPYTIVVSASPPGGGTVSGAGAFPPSSLQSVTATPASGYDFANWTENGIAVSVLTNYTFSLTTNRNLVAHFVITRQSTNTPGNVVAWGGNDYGQTNVPPGLTNVMAITGGGGEFSAALKADGTVVAWGDNDHGQTNVPAGLSNVVAIAGSGNGILALKSDGTVAAWGSNDYGERNVPAGLSNVTAIACGQGHSLALQSDGTVAAWGYNYYGQCNVPAGLTNVVAIAGGGACSMALKGDGTVVAWGVFEIGGNNYIPVNIPADLSNVAAIAGGFAFGLALKGDGTVAVWGSNQFGETNMPAGLSNVVAIAAGRYQSLALKSDGTVTAWGYNNFGQASVPAGLSNVVAVAAGAWHSLALVRGSSSRILRFDTSPAGVQMTSGGFRLTLTGLAGHGPIIIYRSVDLTSWDAIYTNPPTVGSLQFLDSAATNAPAQFYRAVEQ